jgi:hypothetical protein
MFPVKRGHLVQGFTVCTVLLSLLQPAVGSKVGGRLNCGGVAPLRKQLLSGSRPIRWQFIAMLYFVRMTRLRYKELLCCLIESPFSEIQRLENKGTKLTLHSSAPTSREIRRGNSIYQVRIHAYTELAFGSALRPAECHWDRH